ncbi:hypothetical protein [uncultured Aquitalea sp.]|uniref:hypothetical protein n=1 Tax=uncultured Aquitalea sp. TaxID=540272 RepID=UPI0025F82224|nr:hypothetical protein [uncultured Aquitalea sp.]
MYRVIDDLLAVARFRPASLAHYQYPRWACALLLTVLALFDSANTAEMGSNVVGRILFTLLFTWLFILLLVQFMGVWLRMAHWKPDGSLFGLIVLTKGVLFIEPLASWLPDDVEAGLVLLMSLWWAAILVHALATVSGVGRLRVALGLIMFSPLAVIAMVLSLQVGVSMKWISVPEDIMNPAASASQESATLPSAAEDKSDL